MKRSNDREARLASIAAVRCGEYTKVEQPPTPWMNLTVRVLPDERTTLTQVAHASGQSFSAWARDVLIEAAES